MPLLCCCFGISMAFTVFHDGVSKEFLRHFYGISILFILYFSDILWEEEVVSA